MASARPSSIFDQIGRVPRTRRSLQERHLMARRPAPPMSALGHKETLGLAELMSVSGGKADIAAWLFNVGC